MPGPPVAGAYAWWDPSDTATVTTVGSRITALADVVGAHNLAGTSQIALDEPSTGSSLNGYLSPRFTGVAGWKMFYSTLGGTLPVTIFVVARADDISVAGQLVTNGGGAAGVTIGQSGGLWFVNAGLTVAGPAADTRPHVFEATVAANSAQLYIDGIQVLTGDAGANNLTDFSFGSDGGSTWRGVIAEGGLFPSILSEADRQLVRDHLNRKWLAVLTVPTFSPPFGTGHPAVFAPTIDLTDYDVTNPFRQGSTVDLSGSGTATSAGTGSLNVTAGLSGKGTAASAGTASVNLSADLRGHGDASSYGTAQINVTVQLSGAGTAASTGKGNLNLTADLRGHGDAAAAGTGALSDTLSLSGHGDASSAGTASVTVTSQGGSAVSLSGSGAAASAGAGSLAITASLSGTGAASSTGRANVDRTAQLSGQGNNASGATGSIGVVVSLSGAGCASSSGRGAVNVTASLSGHGDACSAGTANIGKTVFLSGSGAAASGGRAALFTEITVSADENTYSGARRNRVITIRVRWVYPCRVKTQCTFVSRRSTRCGHPIRTRVDTMTSRHHQLTASSEARARTVTLADRLQDDMDALILAFQALGARQENQV